VRGHQIAIPQKPRHSDQKTHHRSHRVARFIQSNTDSKADSAEIGSNLVKSHHIVAGTEGQQGYEDSRSAVSKAVDAPSC
jgi:hypothetical protein